MSSTEIGEREQKGEKGWEEIEERERARKERDQLAIHTDRFGNIAARERLS